MMLVILHSASQPDGDCT